MAWSNQHETISEDVYREWLYDSKRYIVPHQWRPRGSWSWTDWTSEETSKSNQKHQKSGEMLLMLLLLCKKLIFYVTISHQIFNKSWTCFSEQFKTHVIFFRQMKTASVKINHPTMSKGPQASQDLEVHWARKSLFWQVRTPQYPSRRLLLGREPHWVTNCIRKGVINLINMDYMDQYGWNGIWRL